MDKDRLAAFVDGELSPEEAAAVVMHLADHPEDQAYVDNLIAANELLAAAFDAPLHEPVPEAIRAAIMGPVTEAVEQGGTAGLAEAKTSGIVLPFRARHRATFWSGGVLAFAAALAAVAILIPGGTAPTGGKLLAVGPLVAGSEIAAVVNDLPSLVPQTLSGGQEVMVLATLPTLDGRFCREVEIIDHAAGRLDLGIACTTSGGGWTVELALQEPLASDAEGFVTAAGPEARAMALFLDQEGAGDALDPAAEEAAIAAGWQR
jgi:Putative zinc-finger